MPSERGCRVPVVRCRGAVCPSRRNAADPYRLPAKTHQPIASVAALTAQPLAALPPYGCGVPLAGSERLAGWQYSGHVFYGMRPPSLSFRGAKRRGNLKQALTISPGLSCVPGVYCEIAAAPAEPRNDKSGGFPHPEGRNDKSENRCGRRAASANPYAISGNCYISQSADKSTHLGFIVAISASFLLRDQLFICFSRSIAALTSGVVSK